MVEFNLLKKWPKNSDWKCSDNLKGSPSKWQITTFLGWCPWRKTSLAFLCDQFKLPDTRVDSTCFGKIKYKAEMLLEFDLICFLLPWSGLHLQIYFQLDMILGEKKGFDGVFNSGQNISQERINHFRKLSDVWKLTLQILANHSALIYFDVIFRSFHAKIDKVISYNTNIVWNQKCKRKFVQ